MLLALISLMIAGILWARDKSRDEVCNEVQVEVINDDSTHFVTPSGIIEEMERHHIIVKGKPLWQINVQDLEKTLGELEYVERVECLFENGGRLKIRVEQIVPVMRVFDGDKSYYVNKDGKRMTAISTFHANVPIVEGHFTEQYSPKRLLPLVEYVEQDSALKSLVSMFVMSDSNNIFIIPAIQGHVVNMGNCTGYEAKFKKLQLFYNKVMPVKGWTYYDTISVKWDHQVVATKRDKTVEAQPEYDPKDDEQDDDMETVKVGENSQALVNKVKDCKKPQASKPQAKTGDASSNNGTQAKPPEPKPKTGPPKPAPGTKP